MNCKVSRPWLPTAAPAAGLGWKMEDEVHQVRKHGNYQIQGVKKKD
jgi:hypothetical protein